MLSSRRPPRDANSNGRPLFFTNSITPLWSRSIMSFKSENSQCFCCRKEKAFKKLKQCSRCKGPLYCDTDCQKKDWARHKPECTKTSLWYDGYRACRDGNVHAGKLELITWNWHGREEFMDEEYDLGWGAVFLEEADDLKERFEEEFKGDLKKFFNYRPNAFRWTCCGVDGSQTFGCDHHGIGGSKPCTCDFCRMGKPLPDSIFNKRSQSQMGLDLSRGPDPRSYNAGLAAMSAMGRSMFGLEM
ncbi:hypothetical protein D9757_005996 [Collybiopsis confluens]|uniref:MYND-type domain-containing protein n=1 Tax=Collybiopsis confluens TaxID=2823264 RepID=A0A8H5HUL4_9AGAR|nr:hypothetical protein D9757_005996 [Collybiopsis confluens]